MCEFCVTLGTFYILLWTWCRPAIPLYKRIGVALWRLSTRKSYQTVCKVFGIDLSNVSQIYSVFRFIKFPRNGRETDWKTQRVYKTKIPQVVGAIDGIYIEILCNDIESGFDYFSGKQKYTINTEVSLELILWFAILQQAFLGVFTTLEYSGGFKFVGK